MTWRTLLLASLLAGCTMAGKVKGRVVQGPPVALQTSTGEMVPLVLKGPLLEALAHTEGHWVDVSGRYNGSKLKVEEWYPVQGAHGMSAWMGTLQPGPNLLDFRTGALYRVVFDDPSMEAWVGSVVLVEGRQDNPEQIHVVHGQVLVHGSEL